MTTKKRQTVETGLGEREVPEATIGLSGAALTLYQMVVLRSSRLRDQVELLQRLSARSGASSADVAAVEQFLRRGTHECQG